MFAVCYCLTPVYEGLDFFHTWQTDRLTGGSVSLLWPHFQQQWPLASFPHPSKSYIMCYYITIDLEWTGLGESLLQSHFQRQWPPALFPGHYRLQSLITCNKQIQKGKTREIWSILVTSGRQRVGWCPTVIIPFSHRPQHWMVLILPC